MLWNETMPVSAELFIKSNRLYYGINKTYNTTMLMVLVEKLTVKCEDIISSIISSSVVVHGELVEKALKSFI